MKVSLTGPFKLAQVQEVLTDGNHEQSSVLWYYEVPKMQMGTLEPDSIEKNPGQNPGEISIWKGDIYKLQILWLFYSVNLARILARIFARIFVGTFSQLN